ncbi:hypothetical protein I656_00912 [Geobacillus sp. WSUCF1]|nr:hypothetical protein I656_00912 [Geobacillus sp. WSUCF1]
MTASGRSPSGCFLRVREVGRQTGKIFAAADKRRILKETNSE